jgi:enterochelin esterase family protein
MIRFSIRIVVAAAWVATTANGQDILAREPVVPARYAPGPDSSPQPRVPKGRLEGPHLLHSKIIPETTRKYWVYVPKQYDASRPACLLVFQDGARAINPGGVIRAPQVLENLIAKGEIPVTIGVFVTPGQRGDVIPDGIGLGNPNNRDREYDVLDDKYARMLLEELLPEVGGKYRITDDPAGRAIGGSSSGAICAFTVAWHRPDKFRNVISMIGSFTNIHGGHVYPELVRKAEKKPLRVFLQDGVHDNRNPRDLNRDWHLQNQKMIAALGEKGYDAAHVIGEGGHSDDHGGAMLPEMLRWIWRDHPQTKAKAADPVAAARALKPAPTSAFPGFDPAAKIDPSGKYSWETRFGGTTTTYTLNVARSEGRQAWRLVYSRNPAEKKDVAITEVKQVGNKVTYAALLPGRGGTEASVTFKGIVSEKGINGWRMADVDGQARDIPWSAKRIKD